MAERPQPPRQQLPVPTSGAHRTRLATAAGVRRNLFTSQLHRRGQTASSAGAGVVGTGATSSDTMPTTSTTTLRGSIDFDPADAEIVVRKGNGDIEVFDPSALVLDDEGGAPDEREEARHKRERLSDNVKQLAMARGPGEDDEFMDALRTSLRAKVASLDEDSWMYEAQEPLGNQ